ncbi:MAG: hypothetical protein AB4426_00110 [Xenococcaceae cyanobacterium]
MSDLIDPTIDLFLYDLKNALNTSKNDIDENQNRFKARLPNDKVKFEDNEIETAYLELTNPIQPDFQPNNESLQGYFYPVRLNDTYGLQLQCSLNNKINSQSVEKFAIIKTEIDQKLELNHKPATIGQTWLLSGYLPKDSQPDPKIIAQKSYQVLVEDANPTDLYGQGIFLEGNLFEFWKINSISSHQNNHFIVAIFSHKHQLDKFINFYPDWMGLFCFRHKINWAYQQSRLIKESLVEHYKRVEENRTIIAQKNQNFSSKKLLNNIQDILNKYTLDLLKLSFQKQVIEINLVNYQTRLEIIQEEAGKNNNLQFFNHFCDLVKQTYLVQIANDIENMQIGLRLLEDNINAIRSRVELEKAERERNFQEFVAIVGAGVAGITLTNAEKDCPILFSHYPSVCEVPLAYNLLIAIVFGGIAWIIRQYLKRSQ